MSEKIISEIMNLINGVITKSGSIPVLKATGRDAAAKWTADRLDEEYEAIRAKLREVLERKPLSDEKVTEIFDDHHADMSRGRIKEVSFRTFARCIERAHGIGS